MNVWALLRECCWFAIKLWSLDAKFLEGSGVDLEKIEKLLPCGVESMLYSQANVHCFSCLSQGQKERPVVANYAENIQTLVRGGKSELSPVEDGSQDVVSTMQQPSVRESTICAIGPARLVNKHK